MFKIGDIVRIVNANADYTITINGTIGEIISPISSKGTYHFKIISLPTSKYKNYVGEAFPIKVNCMELVEAKETIPYEHVISKIKVMQDRFDKRKATRIQQGWF
jgi:hypothetical protein